MEPLELIKDYVNRHSDNPPADMTGQTPLDALGIDSLALYELLFELEDVYGIRFDEEGSKPETVGDMIRFIENCRLQAQAPADQ